MDSSVRKKLSRQLKYVQKNSKFYKEKFKHIEIGNNIEDYFYKLPHTNKQELLNDQLQFPPFGSMLCVNEEEIKRIHKTSGTTDKPFIVALTQKDIDTTVKVGSKCFKSAGLRKGDTVVHCLSYNLWIGGYTDHQSLEATGATVIPFGVGNTRNLIEIIRLLKPDSIHCTPSYLAKIELLLKEEFNLTPVDLGLELGLFGAESGMQNSGFRASIEKKWGLNAMNANYGMADVLSMFGAECYLKNGLHFYGGDTLYAELIDPITKKAIDIEDGAEGELVLTNLEKEAQPLIKYRTNDIIKILSTDTCECGEEGFRFEVIGRSDDMITIKGVNVFVNAIEKVLMESHDLLSGVFEVHITQKDPIDKMIVKAEIKSNIHLPSNEFKIYLSEKFKNRLSITPDIKFVQEGILPRTQGKSRKLIRDL